MTPTALERIAPRLARAWTAHLREEGRRRHLRNQIHEVEKLVAHRELQLVRAQARGAGRYIASRQVKLREAQETLRRLKDKQKEL